MTGRGRRALLALTALSACAAPPQDRATMEAAITAQLRAPAAAAAIVPTGAAGPAAFRAALRAAVEADPGYRAALLREAEAGATAGATAAGLRPQLTGGATVGLLREGAPTSDTTAGAAGELTLSQLVYDGGGSRAAVEGATARALAASAERRARANEVALAAARAWIDLWALRERLALLASRVARMDDLIAQIDRAAANGLVDRATLDAVRRRITEIDLDREEMRAAEAEAEARFRRHFGAVPARLPPPADLIPPQTVRLLAGDGDLAPALERIAADLLAARAAEDEARAAFRPRVSLQAGLVSPMDEGESTDLSAGLRIGYSFGDGGRRAAALTAAKARVAALEAALAEAQQDGAAGTSADLARLDALERSLPILERRIALSEAEADTARSQIVTGQSDLRSLVDAEIENYRARDQQLRRQAETRILQVAVAARAGTLASVVGIAP